MLNRPFPLPRKILTAVILILIPLGFATKYPALPYADWLRSSAGDVLYPMFWYFVLLWIFPRLKPLSAAAAVFAFSAAVEMTQLYEWPVLVFLRRSFLGRTLVGTSFSWDDMGYYFIGCLAAVALHTGLYFFVLPSAAGKPESHDGAFESGGDGNCPPDADAAETESIR